MGWQWQGGREIRGEGGGGSEAATPQQLHCLPLYPPHARTKSKDYLQHPAAPPPPAAPTHQLLPQRFFGHVSQPAPCVGTTRIILDLLPRVPAARRMGWHSFAVCAAVMVSKDSAIASSPMITKHSIQQQHMQPPAASSSHQRASASASPNVSALASTPLLRTATATLPACRESPAEYGGGRKGRGFLGMAACRYEPQACFHRAACTRNSPPQCIQHRTRHRVRELQQEAWQVGASDAWYGGPHLAGHHLHQCKQRRGELLASETAAAAATAAAALLPARPPDSRAQGGRRARMRSRLLALCRESIDTPPLITSSA